MNEPEEVRKWLRLGYETYGPRGAQAIASAMGLPMDKIGLTSPGNDNHSAATKKSGFCSGHVRQLPESRDRISSPVGSSGAQQLEGPAACPASPPRGARGWKQYVGDPAVFHCGFEGFLEDRDPTPESPVAECFYDEQGSLVDRNHPYA